MLFLGLVQWIVKGNMYILISASPGVLLESLPAFRPWGKRKGLVFFVLTYFSYSGIFLFLS